MPDWIFSEPSVQQLPRSLSTPEFNRSIFIHHESLPPDGMRRLFKSFNEQGYVCCVDPQGHILAMPQYLYDEFMVRHAFIEGSRS